MALLQSSKCSILHDMMLLLMIVVCDLFLDFGIRILSYKQQTKMFFTYAAHVFM